jgi:phosphotransferase system IIB component
MMSPILICEPIITGRGNIKELSIELTDFSVFYNQDNGAIDEELKAGRSKVVIENGQVIKVTKDKETNGHSQEKSSQRNGAIGLITGRLTITLRDRKEIGSRLLKMVEEKEIWTGN